MYHSERRYGVKNAYPTREEVEKIVERCGGKNVFKHNSANALCIVRMDLDLPLNQYPDNAALITSEQAAHLPRTKEKRPAVFSKIQLENNFVERVGKDMDNNGELHGALALLGFSLKIKDEAQKNECITEAIGVIKKYIEKPPPPAPSSSSSSEEEEEEENEEEDGEMHLSSDSVSSEPHTPPRDDDDEVVVEDKGFVVDDEEPIEEYDKKSWETIMKKHNEKKKKKIEGRKRARPRVLRYDEEDFPGESDDMGEDCGGAWNVSVTKDMKLGTGAAYEILKFNTYNELEKNNFWRKHFGDAMSEVEANCGGTGKPNEHARKTISEHIRGPTLEGKNVEIVPLAGGRRRTKCCLCGATHMCEEAIRPGDLPVATICRHLAAALIKFYQVLYKGNPDYGQLYVDLRCAMDKVLEASAEKRDKKKKKNKK